MHSLLTAELAAARSAELREGARAMGAGRERDAAQASVPDRERYWSDAHARDEQPFRRPRWRAG